MSQLTDERVKSDLTAALLKRDFNPLEIKEVLDAYDEVIKPLPSYGEVLHKTYCNQDHISIPWKNLTDTSKENDEAAAQAVRRAVYEREIVPIINKANEIIENMPFGKIDLGVPLREMIINFEALIKEFEK